MIKDTHIRWLPIKIIRCRCNKFQADVSSSRWRIKKEKKKITTIILKATRTKLKRKPPLVLRDIENIPYVPQFLNLHFEFDAHTFTYKKKKITTHMEEWSSRCNNIYNPCLYPSICGQQMIWWGKNSKEKREREKMTNDRRNINLSPGRPCVSSSIPNVKLLQIQPGFLALWIGS